MPPSAASDLCLQCLPMSHKKDALGLYGLRRQCDRCPLSGIIITVSDLDTEPTLDYYT